MWLVMVPPVGEGCNKIVYLCIKNMFLCIVGPRIHIYYNKQIKSKSIEIIDKYKMEERNNFETESNCFNFYVILLADFRFCLFLFLFFLLN